MPHITHTQLNQLKTLISQYGLAKYELAVSIHRDNMTKSWAAASERAQNATKALQDFTATLDMQDAEERAQELQEAANVQIQ